MVIIGNFVVDLGKMTLTVDGVTTQLRVVHDEFEWRGFCQKTITPYRLKRIINVEYDENGVYNSYCRYAVYADNKHMGSSPEFLVKIKLHEHPGNYYIVRGYHDQLIRAA